MADAIRRPVMTIAIACSTVVSSMMFSLPGWEYQDGGYLGQDAPAPQA